MHVRSLLTGSSGLKNSRESPSASVEYDGQIIASFAAMQGLVHVWCRDANIFWHVFGVNMQWQFHGFWELYTTS